MTPERVLQHAPLVLDPQARERYFADGFLTVPGYVGGAWLRRLRAVVDDRRVAASFRVRRSVRSGAGPYGREAEHPPAAQGRGSASGAVGLRTRPVRGRSRRGPRWARHPLPQLEAQLQVVRRRGCGALASGYPGLAAHELQRVDLRRLPGRHRARAGPADSATAGPK
jgi:hypothetical protein